VGDERVAHAAAEVRVAEGARGTGRPDQRRARTEEVARELGEVSREGGGARGVVVERAVWLQRRERDARLVGERAEARALRA
jgi:hypothetical protein